MARKRENVRLGTEAVYANQQSVTAKLVSAWNDRWMIAVLDDWHQTLNTRLRRDVGHKSGPLSQPLRSKRPWWMPCLAQSLCSHLFRLCCRKLLNSRPIQDWAVPERLKAVRILRGTP